MFRSFLISLFVFISISYIPFQVQAKFIQPQWGDFSSSVVQKSQRPSTTKAQLLEQFHHWEGVRYQWGGTGVNGIDCSALTQKIYSAALKKLLPRTTGEQIKEGEPVPVSQLLPGDLIFFKPKKSVRHVGIYIGNNKFMHASSSQGVTLSSLENPFWVAHFETARRILG